MEDSAALEIEEEIADIAAFDAAMKDPSPNIPWVQVLRELTQ